MGLLAMLQLLAWQEIARDWTLTLDGRVWQCGQCGKGVMLDRDDLGRTYTWDEDQRLAQVVLHLRAHHPDLDPDNAL
jgi:hypothetical protein